MPLANRLGLLPLLAAALCGCEFSVEGNGVFAERAVSVPAFDRLEIGLGIEATVTAGAADRLVVISGDENVLQHVDVEVSGTALVTSTDLQGGFTTVHPLRLRIEVPSLVGVKASDLAHVTVTGAAAPAFEVDADGQGQVALSGAGGDALAVRLRDRAVLSGFGYPAATAAVDLADGSTGQLHVSGAVTGTVAGGPRGGSRLEIQGGGTCSLTPEVGSTCSPQSP
ncbi:MAG: DUF2807 domain-containing protein [Anaeromyxobacteraceae bacterium]|nr:DUF2807 domain-containing protein [Anaeromyxobacteraceae bacterium]